MRRHGTVIVGGGLIGLATAYALADHDDQILVLDPEPEVGFGASRANGGMLTPALCDPWNAPGAPRLLAGTLLGLDPGMRVRWTQLPALMSWGARFLRYSTPARHLRITLASFELAQFSASELTRARQRAALEATCWHRGTLAVYRTQSALHARQSLSTAMSKRGLHFQSLSPAEVVAREPLLETHADRLVGGLWYPDDQSADSGALCRALAANLTARGVIVRLQCRVLGLDHDRGGAAVRLSDGTQLRPRHLIIAAGVHAPALVAGLGIKLPVAPAKGYSLTLDLPPSAVQPTCPVYDSDSHVVYTPLLDSLRIAGTADFAGFDTTLESRPLERMLAATRALYPMLVTPDTIRAAHPWAGLRPVSADGLPYIGLSAIPGLWLNVGHGALGLTHAMGSGALLADLIMGRAPRIDPTPYRPFGRA